MAFGSSYNVITAERTGLPAPSAALGYWPCQESSGVVAVDRFGVSGNGDLVGWGANVITGAGPRSYFPSAFDFGTGGDNRRIEWAGLDLANRAAITGQYTCAYWVYTRNSLANQMLVNNWANSTAVHQRLSAGFYEVSRINGFRFQGTTPIVNNTWTHLACTFNGGIYRSYVNGVLDIDEDYSGDVVPASSGPWAFGERSSAGWQLDGLACGIYVADEAMTQAEILELYSGPEPWWPANAPGIPTGTPAVGETLTADDSGITDPNNGTITHDHQWVSDGNDVAGETSPTYVVRAGDAGLDVQCRQYAQNDGGYDDASQNKLSDPVTIGGGAEPVPIHNSVLAGGTQTTGPWTIPAYAVGSESNRHGILMLTTEDNPGSNVNIASITRDGQTFDLIDDRLSASNFNRNYLYALPNINTGTADIVIDVSGLNLGRWNAVILYVSDAQQTDITIVDSADGTSGGTVPPVIPITTVDDDSRVFGFFHNAQGDEGIEWAAAAGYNEIANTDANSMGVIWQDRSLPTAGLENVTATFIGTNPARMVGTAFAVAPALDLVTLGTADETDTANALEPSTTVAVTLGTADETDSANALEPSSASSVTLGTAEETDTAAALEPSTLNTVELGTADETDTVQALEPSTALTVTIGTADETEIAAPLLPSSSGQVTLGTTASLETAAALLPQTTQSVTLGQSTETDTAQSLDVQTAAAPNRVVSYSVSGGVIVYRV